MRVLCELIRSDSISHGTDAIAGATKGRSMHSYLPDGTLDTFVADYLRSDSLEEPNGSELLGPDELMAHRNAKAVFEYSYLGRRIIAKVYDDVEDGASTYRVWDDLWTQGFGPESIHRIPEPLIYLPERRAFLMEPAAGECLLPLVLRDPDACRARMQESARWLANLHTSPVRAGSPDKPSRILYRMARKLVRAISRSPELDDTMLTLIADLRLSSLLYSWSATLLSLMLDSVLKRHLDEDNRRARLTYFESEFTDLPDLIADLGHAA